MSNILVNTIKDTGNNTLLSSDGSGSVTLGSGFPDNTPAFHVWRSGDQSQTQSTNSKINYNTTIFDTNSAFDTSTYKFTVPSGYAGKYWITVSAGIDGADANGRLRVFIYINGSATTFESWGIGPTNDYGGINHTSCICTLSVGDYVEGYINYTGTDNITGQIYKTWMTGYKLIGA